MIPDTLVDEIEAEILQCFKHRGENTQGKMRVRFAVYESEETGSFCGMGICPENEGQLFCVDIPMLAEVFDNVEYFAVGNYEKMREGIRTTPHIRFMGIYNDFLIMLNIYMEPVDLEAP